MRQHKGYKPRSNILTSMSVKQKDQSDYFQMREEAAKNKWSQCEVMLLGYREFLQGAAPEVWKQLRRSY